MATTDVLEAAAAEHLTDFEKSLYRLDAQGRIVSIQDTRFKPLVGQVNGKDVLIGYYYSSNRSYKMLDREGVQYWGDEAGLEPSWFSPIDLVGPMLITAP